MTKKNTYLWINIRVIIKSDLYVYEWVFNGYYPLMARAVKWVSPNDFGLALTGFGLNGPGQKSFGLNRSRKLRT